MIALQFKPLVLSVVLFFGDGSFLELLLQCLPFPLLLLGKLSSLLLLLHNLFLLLSRVEVKQGFFVASDAHQANKV